MMTMIVKIETPGNRWFSLRMIVWMISFSVLRCHDGVDHFNDIIDHPLHHHDEKIDIISSVVLVESRRVDNHYKVNPLLYYDNVDDAANPRVDNVGRLKDESNRKTHTIMMTGDDRSLQVLPIKCVNDENGIRLAISNAPDFSSTSTKIDLCSSYIFIDASAPNLDGFQGILIKNKFLINHCIVSNVTHNCIIDAQRLSRSFDVTNSTLVFYDIDFRNGNANNDNLYSSGGAFYVDVSSIKMIDCSFFNNTANSGGSMMIFDSTVKIMASENRTIPLSVENNVSIFGGGFIYATNSILDIYNYNLVKNKAKSGGAISILNSILKLIGSDDSNLPSIIENNVANLTGGFLSAWNSNIEVHN